MKVFLTSVLATTVLLPRFAMGGHARHEVGPDTVVIELSSTVPGREVQFRLVGQVSRSTLTTSQLTTRGDTLIAFTPARLTLESTIVPSVTLLETSAGEPWLHASVAGRGTMDAWGTRFEIEQGTRGFIIKGPMMRWRSEGPTFRTGTLPR